MPTPLRGVKIANDGIKIYGNNRTLPLFPRSPGLSLGYSIFHSPSLFLNLLGP